MQIAKHITKWSLDTLFPKYCVSCHASDTSLCSECFDKIVFIKQQQCGRCLKNNTLGKTCPKCKKHWALDNLLVVAYYQDGPLKEIIHTYKYDGRKDLLPNFMQMIAQNKIVDNYLTSLDKNTFVVPVPLHFRRRWWRGFNQSEEIARKISSEYNIPLQIDTLKRIKHTKIQASLHRKDRMQNLTSAFIGKTCLPNNASVILIDDIATTGATLNACARVLKQAGIKHVRGLVIARAF